MESRFTAFLKQRNGIFAEAAATQEALDQWYKARINREPDFSDLTKLEGLLAARRRNLELLMKLDGDVLSQLVAFRTCARGCAS